MLAVLIHPITDDPESETPSPVISASLVRLPDSDTDARLAAMRECVGGNWVDAITVATAPGTDLPLADPITLWVDDEGLINGQAYNVPASAIFRRHLFGPVLITGHSPNGETLGISEATFIRMGDMIDIVIDHVQGWVDDLGPISADELNMRVLRDNDELFD